MKRPSRLYLTPLTMLVLVGAACGSSTKTASTTTTAAAPTTVAATSATTPPGPATAAPTVAPTVAPTAAPTTAAATTAAGSPTTVASTGTAALRGDITVFAAASLTGAFTEVGTAFTAANPGAKVTFTFDASSALVTQITQGAPADLFASADTTNMDKLTKAGLNGASPKIFATNLLAIIVAPGNPKGITGVADLANASLKVDVCDPTVPCGKYAKQVFDNAKVTVNPVSLEQNVKGVVTKVTAGEADAGIVYTTDVQAAGAKAAGVAIPADLNVVAQYPIASVKTSTHADVDQAFVDFLTSASGQAILTKYGFGKP